MSYSAVDVDWCLTCSKHLDIPGNGYCSPQCEPSPSSRRWDLNSSDDSDDEEPIYHPVEDTSSAKGIAAWAANVPDGAPPRQLSFSPSRSSSQPKLLRPQSSRPAPPALSMSESTSASIPVATPPSAHRNPSVLSSFANHVKSFVSSSPAGFSVGKSKTKPRNDLHKLSITFSSDSSDEDEYDCRPTLSPGDNTFDDVEDLWWVTDSDYSTAPSSPITKKSSAQLIVGSSAARRHELECELYFQPRVLPPELSSRVSRLGLDDEEYHIRSTRGRQVR